MKTTKIKLKSKKHKATVAFSVMGKSHVDVIRKIRKKLKGWSIEWVSTVSE